MKLNDMLKAIDRLVSPLLKDRHLGADRGKIVLAYSGGVDSEVLAAGLSAYAKQHRAFTYKLVHVHHGLSSNADAWVSHCQQRADFYGIPLSVERVQVSKGNRESLEANAREMRYAALARHLSDNDILLTAQHEDDQLETLLLALKRGQGPKGLAAMGECQRKAHYWQCRPLLGFSRQQIEGFAANANLVHIEDESNQDTQYDRNFLRLEIIPALKQRWPSIGQTASRSARLCAEQQIIVDTEVEQRLPSWLDNSTELEGTGFKLANLGLEPQAWQPVLFRGYLECLGLKLPSAVQLEQILTQLLHAKDDANLAIECAVNTRTNTSAYIIRRFDNKAFAVPALSRPFSDDEQRLQAFLHQIEAVSLDTTFNQLAEFTLHKPPVFTHLLPQTAHGPECATTNWYLTLTRMGVRLKLPAKIESVSLRYGAASSLKCQPHFRGRGRELKKLWQELQIPPWRRAQIPLIFYGEQLVAAVGYWVDKAYLAKDESIGIDVNCK